jgi:hypothetical protein
MGSLDASGTTKASDVKGDEHPFAGSYLCVVSDLNYKEKDGKEMDIAECEVVGGTTPGQDGKKITVFMNYENGSFSEKPPRHLRFALATKLIVPGRVEESVDTEFFRGAIGRYLVIRIEEFKKKDGSKGTGIGGFGLDMWPPDDPEVAELVRAMDGKAPQVMQRLAGGAGQQTQQTGQQASQQQTAQRSTTSAPPLETPAMANAANGVAAGGDGWDV